MIVSLVARLCAHVTGDVLRRHDAVAALAAAAGRGEEFRVCALPPAAKGVMPVVAAARGAACGAAEVLGAQHTCRIIEVMSCVPLVF